MEPDTNPAYAIDEITSFLSKIDILKQMDCEDPNSEREVSKLETKIKSFLRTNFRDDDKKIQDLQDARNAYVSKHFFDPNSSVTKQRDYENDLEIIKDHLGVYKTELESVIFSRKKTVSTTQKHIRKKTSANASVKEKRKLQEKSLDNRKIFVVHGHDSLLKQEVELFLKTLSLEPIILHKQASRNRTIIEKVEFYSNVSFAVILMTQDDVGANAGISCNDNYSTYFRAIYPDYLEEMNQHVSKFLTEKEISVKDDKQIFVEIRDLYKILKMRARQNVLFECGYFIGKLDRGNVAILCDDNVEIPTDLEGLCYLKIDTWDSWRKDLAMEMSAAGIVIDEKKVYFFDKMRSYLIEDGFKSLNITSYLKIDQIKDIVNSNSKILHPDFANEMRYMGFIDSNNEITNIGEIFLERAFWRYYVKNILPE